MPANIVQLPIAELVEDMSVYPRHAVDDAHVARLVKALKAGVTFPPVVADSKSKRLSDGWHRTRAHRQVLGVTGVVDVELKDYATNADLILDAISMNAGHGRPLDKIDQVRCVVLAEKAGVSRDKIAVALRQTISEVQKLTVSIATVPQGSTTAIPGTVSVALKRPVRHLAGTVLTKQQAEAQQTVPGTSYLLIAEQLLEALQLDMINRQDVKLLDKLRQLKSELMRYFK